MVLLECLTCGPRQISRCTSPHPRQANTLIPSGRFLPSLLLYFYFFFKVSWQADDLDKNKNFTSVSSDGRVTLWTLIKSELHHTDLMFLRHDAPAAKKEVSLSLCFLL